MVVEVLSRNGMSTLAELRHATGLSNATLFRLLATLQERNWVRRNIVEGQFELAHSLGDILGANARAHPLAELAGPILLELKSRQAGLPSDLCALTGPGKIEIVESTRLRGPMAPTRTALGIRPSLVLSAHGRTMLAFLNEAEREAHFVAIRQSGTKEERSWIESGRLEKELEATRERGYGLREEAYWQAPFDHSPDLNAMAVPILSKSGLHGSLSLLWIRDDMSREEVLQYDSLTDLQKAAARIGVAMNKANISAPAIAG